MLECQRCGGSVELSECVDESDDGFTELYRCVHGCGWGRYSFEYGTGDETRTGVLETTPRVRA